MKKIFLVAAIFLIAATATFANNNSNRKERKENRIEKRETRKEFRKERRAENRNEVSSLTKERFTIDFPDAKYIVFSKTKEFDEVSFMSGRKKLMAFYDYDSKLVGTTQKKAFSDLPESAQKEILKRYGGYAVARVIKFEDNADNNTDMILFDTPFYDDNSYFVELKEGSKDTIVQVNSFGGVSFFKDIK